MNLPEWFKKSCQRIEPVGSRITCLPAPTDTDQDYLCLPHEKMDIEALVDLLVEDGWVWEREYRELARFSSVRKGEDNLIISHSEEHFNNFMRATIFCKRKNVLDKKERVRIFNLIMKPKKSKQKKVAFGLTDEWLVQQLFHVNWAPPPPIVNNA